MIKPALKRFEHIVTGAVENINLVDGALLIASNDQLDCFRDAIDDYQRYLMLSPGADDTSYIQSSLTDLKQSAGRLH